VANTGPGDALLFRIARHLTHRVTPVDGTADKTAFAGWFRSEPEFIALLKLGESRGLTEPMRSRQTASSHGVK
jgi:hypothetical protein